MKFLFIPVVAVLSGCVTEQPANQEQVQKLGETCEAYGFKPGTNDFAACIFQLDQARIAENRRTRLAIAAALSNTGAAMQRTAPRAVNCTSTVGGSVIGATNRISTRCY